MKTKIFNVLTLMSVVTITGCGNLSKINDDGTTNNPIFPSLSSETFNSSDSHKGVYVDIDNLKQIRQGMSKEQVIYLIGHPHFNEGLYNVREFDYVFNINSKTCQYKVLFDKNSNLSQEWWYPRDCSFNQVQPQLIYSTTHFDINTDILFDSNKSTLSDIGLMNIEKLAKKLKYLGAKEVEVQGHTDYLGSVAYNKKLSQQRANTIKSQLLKDGLGIHITAIGYGETKPVKDCKFKNISSQRKCLKPNRRVAIIIKK
ncbi:MULTISPECIES: outer membrane protein assembly factor BamE domain-containing protein [Pasteurellaceae]|uniref:Outer membrane protein assembly factor BamE n=1 Tax=Pasteurella atlantica TaxID=2827233 RepID=A0AAW8CGX2_9PAST|nr:outer membrane protein assembly factor BamE [Pasteurella atlantica]MBR0574477.1 outer membrane protein assembly factor BamE [Pasteurella atlantica]MDP8039355.1 outer membrane protein assembly factor BamE [Pasteurella atlantica]MDP8041447.1 outer membrane protein assembly factor BamE [Pasteurella atlantica]MDP8043628.1 outer membrane protein assembly factor BamE [Pasteurella atlantica]MDP8045668.1 outer membrane protein assembly factor BamE [Pasteurella atlantica]